jgi:hypothetical protein
MGAAKTATTATTNQSQHQHKTTERLQQHSAIATVSQCVACTTAHDGCTPRTRQGRGATALPTHEKVVYGEPAPPVLGRYTTRRWEGVHGRSGVMGAPRSGTELHIQRAVVCGGGGGDRPASSTGHWVDWCVVACCGGYHVLLAPHSTKRITARKRWRKQEARKIGRQACLAILFPPTNPPPIMLQTHISGLPSSTHRKDRSTRSHRGGAIGQCAGAAAKARSDLKRVPGHDTYANYA